MKYEMTDEEQMEKLITNLACDIEKDISYSKLNEPDRHFFNLGMRDKLIAEAGAENGMTIWKAVVDELENIYKRKNNQLH